ncbi:MAG: hypothetical protein NT075_32535 [Chloroflexi bacterium]|nr:hypothetical protein [Chloroflexota bacterium]
MKHDDAVHILPAQRGDLQREFGVKVMRSMRNWVVHVYFSDAPKILWDTI